MADCLQKRLAVSQPTYCLDETGEPKEGTVMYNWMHIRSSGPNCMKDNKFCGENEFLDDVVIDGDLTVEGDLNLGGTNNIKICDLLDVDCSDPITDQDVLVYNAFGNNWTNGGLPAGAPIALGDLTDTILAGPVLNQVLTYDGAGNWINQDPPDHSLNDLTDVVIGGIPLANNQHLIYNGVNWVNQLPAPIYQADVLCIELDATGTPLVNPTNNYSPVGYTNQTTTIVVSTTGNTDLTGVVHLGQCYIIIINNGGNNVKLLNLNAGSLPNNQFRLGAPAGVTVQPGEAVNLYHSSTLGKWVLISHL